MAVIHTNGTNGTNGTSGTSPTAGGNGGPAVYTPPATIGADSTTVEMVGGDGGTGGNNTTPGMGAAGGNGGNASATLNGSIYNAPAATNLTVSVTSTGGNGGQGGTVGGTRGNGGNATTTINGNIVQTSKIMNTIEFDAIAIGGNGSKYGNATATLNGNIIQPSKGATTAILHAAAYSAGPDPYANNGNVNFGTKTATVNGNVVQGNISNVLLSADTYNPATPYTGANGTANVNGNVVQLSGANTNSGTVVLEASGQHIDIENNKITVGKQTLNLAVNSFSPSYDVKIKNNEFTGTGAATNTFIFTDTAWPGPRTTPDVININLSTETFTFNGDSNKLSKFPNVTVVSDNNATVTGDLNANVIITGSGGNDLLTGGAGNDTLDGGAGNFDTAMYSGNFAQYSLSFNNLLPNRPGTVTDSVAARDGTDTLQNIEFLKFADGLYDVALGTFSPTVPLSHAPAGTDKTIATLEDASYTLTVADFGFTDPNDLPPDTFVSVKITTLPSAGSLTLNNVAVIPGQDVTVGDINSGLLKFAPAANANGAAYSNFTFQVQDSRGTQNLDLTPNTITFDVTAVNDAPAGTSSTITMLEDGSRILTAADFGFSDPVDAASASGANAFAGVVISSLPLAGTLTLNGNPVIAGTFVTAAQLAANQLVFAPAANANGAGYASFNFAVRDNGGVANGGIDTDQTPNTLTFDVTSVNDAPAGTSSTITMLEDGSRILTAADFGFSDPIDAASASGANAFAGVVISSLPLAGTLTLNGNPVIAGTFVTAAQLAANQLVFAPAANANGAGYASFNFAVRDNGGLANGGIDTDQTPNTLTFDVTSVNDAPAGTSSTITMLEDGSRILTAADFGFSDPVDAASASGANAFAGVVISSLPLAGTLTLNGNPVIAGTFVTAAQLAANQLVFAPASNANGNGYASFNFAVRDNGGVANGGIDTDQTPNTLNFNVTSVNDAPDGTDNTVSTQLNTAYVFSVADFGFSDANDTPPNNFTGFLVTSLPVAGSLTDNGNPVQIGDFVTVADIMAGQVVFTPGLNGSGNGYASFGFAVRDDGGVLNGGQNTDQTPNTITIDVASNTFFGTPGPDNLAGTPGNDTFIASVGPDTYNALGGSDTLVFQSSTGPLTVDIGNPNPQPIGGGFGTNTYLNFENVDTSATSSNNTLTGNAADNNLKGGSGDDTFFATAGNDVIDGGGNTAVGDTVNFANFAGGVFIDLNNAGPQGVAGGTVTLSNIENLTGGAGNDIFVDNASGNNKYAGGGGIDTVVFNNSGNSIAFTGGHFVTTGPNGTDTTDVEIVADPLGRTLLVGGPGGFATIQAAVNAATAGDTILIAPGTYNENVTIDATKTGLTVMGAGPGVIIEGTFTEDQTGTQPTGSLATWLQTRPQGGNPGEGYSGASGTGINVSANGVTLKNLTVHDFLTGVSVSGAGVSGLTLDGVSTDHNVFGFTKPDDTTLTGATITNSSFTDEYIGVGLFNDAGATGGPGFGKDATDTTITNSNFSHIDAKGIYAETAMGNTVLDGITMNDVGQFGRVPTFGNPPGVDGNGIDFNLKYHDYSQANLDIGNFNLTNVGGSAGQNGGIVVEARDDAPTYSPLPAIVDDGLGNTMTVNIHDGSIDGTSTGIRAGEIKANPAQNVTGPAVNVTNVAITNATVSEIDNHTNSLMTVLGTSGDDNYTSAQMVGSTGQYFLSGLGGNDYLMGGLGDDTLRGGTGDDMLDGGTAGVNTADYSDATQNGLIVNLQTGLSSGGGLGNDTLQNISNVTGSSFNDTLIGDDNDNLLFAGDGNDKLYGQGGNNTLVGGNGTDVAYYTGLETSYVAPTTGSVAGGADNVNDNLIFVERLKFLSAGHVADVDNNGAGDIVFQNNTTGDLQISSQPEPAGTISVAGIGGNNWRAVGTGQFDPDNSRQAGVLLQDNATGNLKVVTDLTGAQTQTALSANPGGAVWRAVAVGDFDGDASSDVLVQNQTTGATKIMFLKANDFDTIGTVDSTLSVTTPGSGWKAISSGDFNNDGKSDILWQNSTTKAVKVYEMNGNAVINTPATQAAPNLTAIGTGDFNGDGMSDILFQNATGQAVLWYMIGDVHVGSQTIAKPGAVFTLSGAADVDGNGASDLIWNDMGTDNTTATLLTPNSLVNVSTSNLALTAPGSTFHIVASTGGG